MGESLRRWCRDPLLVGGVAWTLLAYVLFFLLSDHGSAQARVFWWFQPPLDALLVYSSWSVTRIATGPILRFWRVMTAGAALFILGDTIQSITTLTGHPSMNGGQVQTACFVVALVAVILAMLLHPHPGRSSRERLAFWLDSAAVLVGGAVVAWCFAVNGQNLLFTLGAAGVALTAAFAAIKMILSNNAPMHKAAAIPMIASAVVISVGFFFSPATTGHLGSLVYAIRLAPSLLIALGPRVQVLRAGMADTVFGERRRKPYSLLPYGSLAIAFGALLYALTQGIDARLWGVVAGLGVISVIVVFRQLTAFHDNARLIGTLDTTLAELRLHETRLRHQALFDGLTGLANRTHFHEEVEIALADPERVTLLLIDLDGFKAVNDTMGHGVGDALLVGVAEKLRASIRAEDLAARLGGDEFAVLLRDCEPGEAERTSQRILGALTVPVLIDGTPVQANASIGVAGAAEGDGVGSLIRAADMAMYAAKHEGKGTWMRYEPSMGQLL